MGRAASDLAASIIRETLVKQKYANIILATGTSQFEMLSELIKAEDVDWTRVRMFHLDEYIGINEHHPASFRKYLQERFIDRVAPMKSAILIEGDAPDIQIEIQRLNKLIEQHPIDVAMIGIGENAHLAFNDPPADFETEVPYLVVDLDETCRAQQLGEGWFPDLDAVPRKAISMSIRQIMKAKSIVCSVPDTRKALAVAASVTQNISNKIPGTILQEHPSTYLYLDTASAHLLPSEMQVII